jgi:hypothetical protein
MPCRDNAAYSNTFDAYLHGMEICSGKEKKVLYVKMSLYLFLYSNTFDAYLNGMDICSGKNFSKNKKVPCIIYWLT